MEPRTRALPRPTHSARPLAPGRAPCRLAVAIAITTMLWAASRVAGAAVEPPRASTSSPATEATGSVALDVTIDLGQDDDAIAAIVGETVTAALGEADLIVDANASRTLTVDVRWAQGSRTDYSIEIRRKRGDAGVFEDLHAFVCAGCTAPQLLERLTHGVEQVVVPALAEDEASEPVLAAVQPGPQPRPTPAPSRPQRHVAPRTGPMFYTGIGFLVAGGGTALAAGVGFVLIAAYDLPTRPLDWSLLPAGIGTTAIGATLVGVARARQRKVGRTKGRATTIRIAPAPMGLALSGRF